MLLCPLRFQISLKDGTLDCVMKLFFFIRIKLTNRPDKKKKPKRQKKQKQPDALPDQADKPEAQSDAPAQTSPDAPPAEEAAPPKKGKKKQSASGGYLDSLKPKSLPEAIYLVKAIFASLGKPTRIFCKGCAIRDIEIDFVVANEDAAKCAILYGTVNMILYNTLAWLSRPFRVKKRRISVGCRYNSSDYRYDLSFTVSLCPLLSLAAAIGLAAKFWWLTRNGLSEDTNR
ncbi:MAG: DUF2953 domain-containing protein [Ruminococcus sp.]|nr:DUF2953 domain-containing protein [Ruminococcus sp.]